MRRTILLADDSPTIRRLVTQIFADGDFQIVEVNNGDAAIKSFEEVRPSIVLADIYMPGKNGYQVCRYIRDHSELSQTPVVLLVGAFDAFDESAAKEAGATASITKPFEAGALIELVKSVLPSQAAKAAAEPESVTVQQRVAPDIAKPAAPAPPPPAVVIEAEDILGLESIFKHEPQSPGAATLSEDEIDRIADRVIQKLSTQVIENIAWDIVPDITEKIVREELKRTNEG
jgi:CheY-like chemotaxis protein